MNSWWTFVDEMRFQGNCHEDHKPIFNLCLVKKTFECMIRQAAMLIRQSGNCVRSSLPSLSHPCLDRHNPGGSLRVPIIVMDTLSRFVELSYFIINLMISKCSILLFCQVTVYTQTVTIVNQSCKMTNNMKERHSTNDLSQMNDWDWGLWSQSGPRTELQIDSTLSEADILFAGDIKAHLIAALCC